MKNIWESLDKTSNKVVLLKTLTLGITFLAGMGLNATYGFIDWVKLPYNNQRDIVILLEKSQEFGIITEAVKKLREDVDDSKLDNINLVGEIKQLKDGQLQLFLKVERLDERSLNNERKIQRN